MEMLIINLILRAIDFGVSTLEVRRRFKEAAEAKGSALTVSEAYEVATQLAEDSVSEAQQKIDNARSDPAPQ